MWLLTFNSLTHSLFDQNVETIQCNKRRNNPQKSRRSTKIQNLHWIQVQVGSSSSSELVKLVLQQWAKQFSNFTDPETRKTHQRREDFLDHPASSGLSQTDVSQQSPSRLGGPASFWPSLMFFQLAEGHRTRGLSFRANPKTKASKQRSREGGAEGVEVDQRARQDLVEGQKSSWTIHKHSYSVGDRGGGGGGGVLGQVHHSAVVPDGESSRRTAQTPGVLVHSKPAGGAVAFPPDAFVGDGHVHHSPPLQLPVAATSQTSSREQLAEALEPVRVLLVLLVVPGGGHAPAVLRHPQLPVGRVRVQKQLAGNWRKGASLSVSLRR